MMETWVKEVAENGFVLVPGVFSSNQVEDLLADLNLALARYPGKEGAIRSQSGIVCAARNVLNLCPEIAWRWRCPLFVEILKALLGKQGGLVRVLYFDKPPNQTWALPWHKDLTIAVRDHRLPSRHFSKPTRKANVPHVEASREILQTMLTMRIHLDDVTEENGPLKVLPGSHKKGKQLVLGDIPPHTVLCNRGDVLLMRPLLAHSSGRSHLETHRHRRIVHLEFAAEEGLPDGYAWNTFVPLSDPTSEPRDGRCQADVTSAVSAGRPVKSPDSGSPLAPAP